LVEDGVVPWLESKKVTAPALVTSTPTELIKIPLSQERTWLPAQGDHQPVGLVHLDLRGLAELLHGCCSAGALRHPDVAFRAHVDLDAVGRAAASADADVRVTGRRRREVRDQSVRPRLSEGCMY